MLAGNVMFLLGRPGAGRPALRGATAAGRRVRVQLERRRGSRLGAGHPAMDDHAADGGFAGFLHRPPFDAVPAMEAMLRRGYRGIGTTQRVAEVRYASPDAWWEASWNQAPALFWEKIPEPDPPPLCGRRTAACAAGSASVHPGCRLALLQHGQDVPGRVQHRRRRTR